ncbi:MULTISPECIES: gluzincin family metallopeptidase [Rhizobium]|jgi:hypothetical protein|uniref:hypothetical protein n=1 Tax=Rhizobium TaxID=379 RepID=UPI00037E2F27|nr:hypothetical protein [Rhizobium ruizarguesonis]
MSAGPAYPTPNARRLRVFSFDPALAAQYDLAGVSGVTIEVPWEGDLKPGPVSEYIEVVDVDPGSDAAYAPIDLNAFELLATDGLTPSESDPRFHQQMVYAVAMKTIEHFELALGRKALWSSHRTIDGDKFVENYVPRLRIYPHALRQQNAYYSPLRKALMFGYFAGNAKSIKNVAGTVVFTCLSHDIIAHETTHALLDGVHPRFHEPVNEDVLAFHEAFADIVALFQHFSCPGVLRDQIARTRGDLARESMLGQLAQQFALASGRGDALRSYLGSRKDGTWQAATPDATLLGATSEPHDRGAILVAAVFGAFMKVYKSRTRDLFRIASEGTGVLREGDIHPDLVNRLAEEAQRCAERILQMCIRAIDYCPPVAITFGAYLRAIVTADYDMSQSDRENWRLAFIESFREWGISPRGIRSMAEDSLLWPTEKEVVEEQAKVEARAKATALTNEDVERSSQRSREAMTKLFGDQLAISADDEYAHKAARKAGLARPSGKPDNVLTPIALSMSRYDIWLNADKQAALFHSWLMGEDGAWLADALGLVVNLLDSPKTISTRKNDPTRANIEIHSIRTAMKRGALGFPEPHMVVVVTQWRAGFFDKVKQTEMDETPGACNRPDRDFKYRAGCTLLIDPEQIKIRRVIRTPGNVADDGELDLMRRYLLQGLSPPNAFASASERFKASAEPFAFLHAHAGE